MNYTTNINQLYRHILGNALPPDHCWCHMFRSPCMRPGALHSFTVGLAIFSAAVRLVTQSLQGLHCTTLHYTALHCTTPHSLLHVQPPFPLHKFASVLSPPRTCKIFILDWSHHIRIYCQYLNLRIGFLEFYDQVVEYNFFTDLHDSSWSFFCEQTQAFAATLSGWTSSMKWPECQGRWCYWMPWRQLQGGSPI